MTTAITNTDSRIPDDVVGIQMARDGSGQLHTLAPCLSYFMGIDIEWLRDGSVVHTAFFRPTSACNATAAGDAVHINPPPRGPN